jgi:hydrogenase expression/formation protein HypE
VSERVIQLGHGGGGLLSRELIAQEISSRFGDGPLKGLPDGALLPNPGGRLVFTTDSFVVHPAVFPGGNIGDLAVHGTVNDLAVCGAVPQWISLALILEEGLPFAVLRTVLDSVRRAADACGVQVVTGDTKVVEKGRGDGIYINTAGIGIAMDGFSLSPDAVVPGDAVLVSGPLGDHGMAVMAVREGIRVSGDLVSDSAPVHRLVQALLPWAAHVRFMRDPTRGGAAATLNEIAEGRSIGIALREADIPFSKGARGLAEMLGFDLLHVASEGRLICICAGTVADDVLSAWRALPEGGGAARTGTVNREAGRVTLETVTGGRRIVDVPQGELLPRIC